MRIISKIRSLSSLRRPFRIDRSVSGGKSYKTFAFGAPAATARDRGNERLLLKREYGDPENVIDDLHFSALSTESFKPIESPCMPCFKGKVGTSASCNGWLLVDSLLWNPSTNQIHFLPKMSTSFCSGLGFDSKTQDYKVIRLHHYFGYFGEDEDKDKDKDKDEDEDDEDEDVDVDVEDEYEDAGKYSFEERIEVYSFNSNSWRRLNHPLPGEYILTGPSTSAYVDGSVYWTGFFKDGKDPWKEVVTWGIYVIIAFDFAIEEFSLLHLPKNGMKFRNFHDCTLVEFNGFLGAIAYPRFGTDKRFELWVYKNKDWVLMWRVGVPGAELPVGLWRNFLFLEGIHRELMVYDLTTKDLTKLGIYDYPTSMNLIPYVENHDMLIPMSSSSGSGSGSRRRLRLGSVSPLGGEEVVQESPFEMISVNGDWKYTRRSKMSVGVDYKHWLICWDEFDEGTTDQQIVDHCVKALSQLLGGGEEEAKKRIYSFQRGFNKTTCGILADWETASKLQDIPGVKYQVADPYLNREDYGGELVVNGKLVPSPYKKFVPRNSYETPF